MSAQQALCDRVEKLRIDYVGGVEMDQRVRAAEIDIAAAIASEGLRFNVTATDDETAAVWQAAVTRCHLECDRNGNKFEFDLSKYPLWGTEAMQSAQKVHAREAHLQRIEDNGTLDDVAAQILASLKVDGEQLVAHISCSVDEEDDYYRAVEFFGFTMRTRWATPERTEMKMAVDKYIYR